MILPGMRGLADRYLKILSTPHCAGLATGLALGKWRAFSIYAARPSN
jgi:hypothetical protein